MKETILLTSKDSYSVVKIDKGELISYKKNGVEFIHQKGSKGWRNSDDEMFPIIGPTLKNKFRVHTNNGNAILDQHGLLRELNYSLFSHDFNAAMFLKKYKKKTLVKNSKFPSKSSEEFLYWTYDFTFEKHFYLDNDALKIDFIITSEKDMPFMFGYHPAFLLSNSGEEKIIRNNKLITLKEIINSGSNAYPILNSDKILLKNINKKDIEVSTKGFNNFMLWTEVNNMLCIEPITHYTSFTDQVYSEKNMNLLKGKKKFSVKIKVV